MLTISNLHAAYGKVEAHSAEAKKLGKTIGFKVCEWDE